MIMKKSSRGGQSLLCTGYQAPSVSMQSFAAETGFAQSGNGNGISKMETWSEWEN